MRVSSRNLHEHFSAFLNVNNLTGFAGEEEYFVVEYSVDEVCPIPEDTIIDLLTSVFQHDMISENRFKKMAKQISRGSSGAIAHSRALDIISRVFGYTHWYDANKFRKNKNVTFFENRRIRSKESLIKLLERSPLL